MKVLVETTQTLPQFSRLHLSKDLKDEFLHFEDLLCEEVCVDGESRGVLFEMIDMLDYVEDVDFVLIVCCEIVDLD